MGQNTDIENIWAYRVLITIYSKEEERMHVHVMLEKGEAKFRLEPDIKLAKRVIQVRPS